MFGAVTPLEPLIVLATPTIAPVKILNLANLQLFWKFDVIL